MNGDGERVTNVSAVACVFETPTTIVGGTVTGLVGTGFILENSSDSELLPIGPANGNQEFTFKNLVPTGTAYNVTILTEPTAPRPRLASSALSTGSGTATANVTTSRDYSARR